MANYRLQSLNAKSAIFADPNHLSHTLRQNVNVSDKKIGQTDVQLNRCGMKEIIPLQIVDGTSSKTVNQTIAVDFSGYTHQDSLDDLTAGWVRMKANVDAAIADGMLKGFLGSSVTFTAGE